MSMSYSWGRVIWKKSSKSIRNVIEIYTSMNKSLLKWWYRHLQVATWASVLSNLHASRTRYRCLTRRLSTRRRGYLFSTLILQKLTGFSAAVCQDGKYTMYAHPFGKHSTEYQLQVLKHSKTVWHELHFRTGTKNHLECFRSTTKSSKIRGS